MSALTPKADIGRHLFDVRYVPIADMRFAMAANGMPFVSRQQAPSAGQMKQFGVQLYERGRSHHTEKSGRVIRSWVFQLCA